MIFYSEFNMHFAATLLLTRRYTGRSMLFVKCNTKFLFSNIDVTVLSVNSTGNV